MIFKGSRYPGRQCLYGDMSQWPRPWPHQGIRFIPPRRPAIFTPSAADRAARLLANKYYRNPEKFWLIADANTEMDPEDLLEPGRQLLDSAGPDIDGWPEGISARLRRRGRGSRISTATWSRCRWKRTPRWQIPCSCDSPRRLDDDGDRGLTWMTSASRLFTKVSCQGRLYRRWRTGGCPWRPGRRAAEAATTVLCPCSMAI